MDQPAGPLEDSALLALDTAASAIFVFRDSTLLYANEATSKLTGYAHEELIGMSIWRIVHPEFHALIGSRVSAWERGETVPPRSEFKIVTKSGETRWVDVDSTFIEFDGRRAALSIAYDSTSHKRAEEALSETEERYRRIIETAQEAIWIVDSQAVTTYANEPLAQMFGYTRVEMIGRSVFDFVDVELRRETRQHLERGRQGIKQHRDFQFRRKDGSELCAMVSTTPLFDSNGEFIGGLATLIDITERKRAERALKQSEALLSAAIDNLPFELWARDREGKCIIQNPYSVLQWGDQIGKGLEEMPVGAQVLELWQSHHRRVLADEVVKEEFEVAEGERAGCYYSVVAPIRIDGVPQGTLGVNIDITDRKRAEQAIRESQEHLRHVLQYSPALIYKLKVEGERLVAEWVSESLVKLTGHRPDEALAEGWWIDHIHPDDRALVLEALPRLFANDRVTLEYRFRHKEMGYLWIHDELRLLRDELGRPIEAIGSWIDVTERKSAEEALRQAEEKYRNIFNNAVEGIFQTTPDGRALTANPALASMFGYDSPEELIQSRRYIEHEGFVIPEERGRLTRLLEERGVVRGFEYQAYRKDGTKIWLSENVRAIRNHDDGAITHYEGTVEDITERKRLREALEVSEERFRAFMSHLPGYAWIKKVDGRYVYLNERLRETLSDHQDDWQGRTDPELFPPDIAAGFQHNDGIVVNTRRALQVVEPWTWKGEIRYALVSKFPIFDTEGNIAFVAGASVDITELKRAENELRKQKEVLQKIFDHIPVMIRFRGEDGAVKLVNREWERTLGWTLEQLQERDVDMLVESSDADYRKEVLDFIGAATGEWADFKTRTRDGRIIDTSWASFRLSDNTLVGFGLDITERKRADELLRRQAAQLAALHEIDLEISAESDLTRVLSIVTRRAAELMNASHCTAYIRDSEQGDLRVVASLDPELIGTSLGRGKGLAGRVAVTGRAQAVGDYSRWTGRARAYDPKKFGPSLSAPLKWQQTIIGAISLSRERGEAPFTADDLRFLEQIAAEAAIAVHQGTLIDELQESRRRLQVLSHRLIDVQEAERKRLARELHDQIGQALTAVQISLQSARPSPDDGTSRVIDGCLAILDEALQLVHDLSLDLRPSLLDDLGLGAALRWYVERTTARAGLEPRLSIESLRPRLSSEVETACFRIAQEALTNIVRHARAKTVWVSVAHEDSLLKLAVRDDGVGFDLNVALAQKGPDASLGLQGMQERASALGGVVSINSTPGKGTEVQASFPL